MEKEFEKLVEIFIKKNSELNLSAIKDPDSIYHKHILDSISLLNFINLKGDVLDLGTGGGFPGLPLAMKCPEVNFTLLDSTKKKVEAVKEMADRLKLSNVKTLWSRAEDYKVKQFDYVVARSVTYIDDLLRFSSHLVKKDGNLISYKLPNEEELQKGKDLAGKYKFKFVEKYEYKILDQTRALFVFEKL